MPRPGETVSDPISGTHLVFREIADGRVGVELRAAPRWFAGPTHVHPKQEERIEVGAGTLRSRVGGNARMHQRGDVLRIPAGTPHTIWNAGEDELRLSVEFRPALRMAELFETAIGLGRDRRTTTPLRELLHVLVATRGYRDEYRLAVPTWVADGAAGGLIAAIASGIPSTVHAFATGRSPLESSLAAGSLLLPREQRPHRLLAAAVPVHLALSVGWGQVLAAVLPRRHAIPAGAAAGVAIAAFDLGLVWRRFRRIRGLPLLPQIADHVAYGAVVAIVVARRRKQRFAASSVNLDR